MSEHTSSSGLLSAHVREEIDHWVAKFPAGRQRSAVIGALHAVQHENRGFLTPELMTAVAEYLKLPPIQVFEVASFYSMFETKPVGRHSVSVCTNISCQLVGAWNLLHHAEERLGIKAGSTTDDGMFTIEDVECIAACTEAPALQVNYRYRYKVTPESFDQMIADLQAGRLSSEVPPHGTLATVRQETTDAWSNRGVEAQAKVDER